MFTHKLKASVFLYVFCCFCIICEGVEKKVAIVVRGLPHRDCGHGKPCDAKSDGPQRWCAESHVHQFIEPAEAAGYDVDVLIASYQCPGRDDWTQIYRNGYRNVSAHMLDVTVAARESQLDSMLRALRLLDPMKSYTGILVTRNDLLFLTSLMPLLSFQRHIVRETSFWFHADLSDGAAIALRKPHHNVTAVTDKLYFAVGPDGIRGFIDAVQTDCFNNGDDDGDPRWISAEHCYASMAKRLGDERIAFMRDHIGTTDPNTFGDNQLGDGIYLVLPRAFGSMSSSAEHREHELRLLLNGDHYLQQISPLINSGVSTTSTTIYDLRPYISGHCARGVWTLGGRRMPHRQYKRKQGSHDGPGRTSQDLRHFHHTFLA